MAYAIEDHVLVHELLKALNSINTIAGIHLCLEYLMEERRPIFQSINVSEILIGGFYFFINYSNRSLFHDQVAQGFKCWHAVDGLISVKPLSLIITIYLSIIMWETKMLTLCLRKFSAENKSCRKHVIHFRLQDINVNCERNFFLFQIKKYFEKN